MPLTPDSTKREWLEGLLKRDADNTLSNVKYSSAIIAKSAEDIESSIDGLQKAIENATQSSEKFSGRIYFLNVILTIATVVGAIATFASLFKQ